MKYIKDWKTFKKINEAEILDTKTIKKHKNVVFESQASDDLNKALQDKKDFVSAYREILLAHKKAIKNKVLDDTLKNQFKQNFLNIVSKYNVDSIEKFNNYVANLIKDRNFISLKKDFSVENKVYLDYFNQSKNLPIVKEVPKVAPTVVDASPLPETAPAPATATMKYVLTNDDKSLLTKPNNLETLVQGKKVSNVKLIEFIHNFLNTKEINKTVISKETDAAIKNYQKSKGLEPDGKIGEKTWTAIFNDLGITMDKKYIKVDVSNVAQKTTPQKTTPKILASKLEIGKEFDASSLITEKLDNLDGVKMTVVKPMYKNIKGAQSINVKFTKDGKPLFFGTQTDGIVELAIDASGNIAKGSKDALLKNLIFTPLTKNPNSSNAEFKDYNGDLDDKFTNTSKLFRDTAIITTIKDKIIKLLRNNNNTNSIKALNDIYYKIKKESLVDLLLKIIPIIGGTNPNLWMKVPDIEFAFNLIINSLVDKYADAKIINFAIGDLKTRNIKYMIEKLFKRRANQPESYKQGVADVYKQKYTKTLESVLVDALTDKYLNRVKDDDIKLIRIMIPKNMLLVDQQPLPAPTIGKSVADATTGKKDQPLPAPTIGKSLGSGAGLGGI